MDDQHDAASFTGYLLLFLSGELNNCRCAAIDVNLVPSRCRTKCNHCTRGENRDDISQRRRRRRRWRQYCNPCVQGRSTWWPKCAVWPWLFSCSVVAQSSTTTTVRRCSRLTSVAKSNHSQLKIPLSLKYISFLTFSFEKIFLVEIVECKWKLSRWQYLADSRTM